MPYFENLGTNLDDPIQVRQEISKFLQEYE